MTLAHRGAAADSWFITRSLRDERGVGGGRGGGAGRGGERIDFMPSCCGATLRRWPGPLLDSRLAPPWIINARKIHRQAVFLVTCCQVKDSFRSVCSLFFVSHGAKSDLLFTSRPICKTRWCVRERFLCCLRSPFSPAVAPLLSHAWTKDQTLLCHRQQKQPIHEQDSIINHRTELGMNELHDGLPPIPIDWNSDFDNSLCLASILCWRWNLLNKKKNKKKTYSALLIW